MLYLLSALLIIHGIICLLGAFFPLYPPVYFFYVFFPGHFAIRLIIVLLVGAAQLAYGIYLALRKKWRIRWYWLTVATIVITGLLMVYPAMQSPGLFGASAGNDENRQPIPVEEMYPSLTGPEAPDDIMPAPGMGPAYRANIHQQGVENPWPPIDTTEVTLGTSFETDTVYARYRDYIETEAGESRNNIVFVSMGNRAVSSLNLYTVNLLTGIKVTEGMRWHGPGAVSVVLMMEIAPDVQVGQYNFGIGIEVDGKDYGTIPCTIKVLEATVAGIPSEPEEPYEGNHGITSTRATWEPGDKIYQSSSLMIELTIDDLIEKSDAIVIGKVIDIFPARRVDINGDWIITTDAVIEVERYLYGQSRSPYIAVMVQGGRVEQTFVWVEDQPEFNLGEEAALFLNHPQLKITPTEGFEAADYYMVTGSMQGKFGYKDGYMVNLEGGFLTVSEMEQKIAAIHSGK